jgi:hypothetical protein
MRWHRAPWAVVLLAVLAVAGARVPRAEAEPAPTVAAEASRPGPAMDRHRRWERDANAAFAGHPGRSVGLRFGDLRAGPGRADRAAGTVLELLGQPGTLALTVTGWAAVRAPGTVWITARAGGRSEVFTLPPGIGAFTQTFALPLDGAGECRVRVELHGSGGGFLSVTQAAARLV